MNYDLIKVIHAIKTITLLLEICVEQCFIERKLLEHVFHKQSWTQQFIQIPLEVNFNFVSNALYLRTISN